MIRMMVITMMTMMLMMTMMVLTIGGRNIKRCQMFKNNFLHQVCNVAIKL